MASCATRVRSRPFSSWGPQAVEAGPVRATVRLSFAWKGSTVREDVYLYEGDEALGLRLLVDWAEGSQLLKMVVPVADAGAEATVGLPYGAITRPSDGREEVMQRWVDVATSGGGLTCASDFTYGYDLADGRLRLTLLRSPALGRPRRRLAPRPGARAVPHGPGRAQGFVVARTPHGATGRQEQLLPAGRRSIARLSPW